MGTNVLLGLIGLATGSLMARLLGPQGRGQLAAIQSWPLLISAFSVLGMPEALLHFASRYPKSAGAYCASALTLAFPMGIALGGLGWWLMPWLLRAQDSSVVTAARVFLLCMIVLNPLVVPLQTLRALGAWRLWNAIRVLPQITWFVVLALTPPATADPIFLGRLFPGIFLFVIIPSFASIRQYVPGPYTSDRALYRPLLAFGVPTILASLPEALSLRLDQLLMATLLPSKLLGMYVVAVAWGGATSLVLSAIGQVLFPSLSGLVDVKVRNALVARVIRGTAVVTMGVTILMLFATPWVLPFLFGGAYRPAIPTALVLVVASLLSNLKAAFADGLRGLGQVRAVLVSEVSGLVVTVVGLSLFLARFGTMGAAIVSLAAYAISCVSAGLSLSRAASVGVDDLLGRSAWAR